MKHISLMPSFKDDFEGVPVFVPFQRKKPYEHGDCRRIFKHKTDHIHQQRVRPREKFFKCDQCGKTFRHRSDVTKHRRIHTGEKPFKCGECGKAFNCGSNFLKHQETHDGEKTYGCEECGKSFAYSSCLIWHWKHHWRKTHGAEQTTTMVVFKHLTMVQSSYVVCSSGHPSVLKRKSTHQT